jgi:hypothetical protein
MKTFAVSLPESLNRKEKRIFENCFCSQPWLGGLTLTMLDGKSHYRGNDERDGQFGHFSFLRPAILALLNNPLDLKARGALIKLLAYYGEMTNKRRTADRDAQRRRKGRNAAGRPPKDSAREMDKMAATADREAPLKEIAEHLCEKLSVTCKCDRKRQSMTLEVYDESGRRMRLRCERCGHMEDLTLTEEDIRKLSEEFKN